MDRKIRVGAVSYLNAKPLTYAIEQGQMKERIDLKFNFPAEIAAQLLKDDLDLGLVPVAILPHLNSYTIITDYCISAYREVASVCVFSDVDISKVDSIYLDYQSRSSVALLQILLTRHWQIQPRLVPSFPGFESLIKGTTAGLIIGDRALNTRSKFRYIYDLATAWWELTDTPPVFAAWVANKQLDPDFIKQFNGLTGIGLNHLHEIAEKASFADYDLYTYYTRNIDYRWDEAKKQSLEFFLGWLPPLKI